MTVPEDHDLDLDRLVPLGALVAEGLGESVDQLARQIGDDVFRDDIGLRCCTRESARVLFAEREALHAAARERAARAEAQHAEMAAKHNEQLRAARERREAIGRAQEKNGFQLLRPEL